MHFSVFLTIIGGLPAIPEGISPDTVLVFILYPIKPQGQTNG